MFFPVFVCLSCEQDYSKKTRAWIWTKCCVSTDVGTWTNFNLLTFEPDPDYSQDAVTGFLSPILYALQRGILLRLANSTYSIGLQRHVVLQWFYSPRAVTLCRRYMRSTECPLNLRLCAADAAVAF